VLSRRDPLTKLAVAFLYLGFVTLNESVASLWGVAAIVLVLLVAVDRVPPRRLLWAMLPFAFFAATSSWIYVVAPDGTSGGWPVARLIASRTLVTGIISMGFAFTTEPADLARALIHRTRLPHRFVHGALAAIQFLPALAEEARMARMVARASLRPSRARLATWIRMRVAGLGPGFGMVLLAGAVRRAGSAAIAMELRGLSARRPSAWRVPRATRRDLAFALAATALLPAVWTLGRL
jgi:energy-coupling factor transport system permease protein